jgi:hypothetical protein
MFAASSKDSKDGDLVVHLRSGFKKSPIPPEGDTVMAAGACRLVRPYPYDGLWNYDARPVHISFQADSILQCKEGGGGALSNNVFTVVSVLTGVRGVLLKRSRSVR